MCGITGFIGSGGPKDLEKMTLALSHRGPDDRGLFYENDVGLGHARLSILDLSPTGHQPMFSKDKKIGIVFNGEIYNFRELKRGLVDKGVSFKSTSDTEVIIALYAELGEKCFEKLEGMFAVAIYDFKKEKLILARDRVGKKPLYYANYRDSFIFGSELKSLMLHPSFEKKINVISVNKYLQYDYVPTPHTIWSGVFKMEAGSYLIFENNKIEIKSFWKPNFKSESLSFDEAKDKLGSMIADAVKKRLVADVPVGVFLSGGLDSSTIAYYAKKVSSGSVQTFSIGFTEESFDESSGARKVAEFLGTKHHQKILTGQDSIDVVSKVLDSLDEPMADASIIPTYLLSQFTKEYVTVALGGDGGDELFAGYSTFQAEKMARIYKILPEVFKKKIIEPVINSLPASFADFSLDFKLKKFINGFDVPDLYRHQVWLGSFGPNEREKVFLPSVWKEIKKTNTFEDIEKIESECNNIETGNRLLYQYQRSYMMDEVMVKVDRATMMASLESRAPLLDYSIIDFVNSLPYSYKFHGFNTKYLLKELMKHKLPAEIVFAKKKGFGMPVAEWLCGPLKPLMEEVLSKENIEKTGLFNYEYIARLKDTHISGRENKRKELWNLLVFMGWYLKWNK